MNAEVENRLMSPEYNTWEAYLDIKQYGEMRLTNVEFTTTTLCNMRCEHCAVGYTLQVKDPDALPIELMIRRLEDVPDLRALSITGGEPMLSLASVKNYVVPLLKYAHERGVRTQINSNLTLDFKRYELIIPYLDVLHISYNYGDIEDFTEMGFGASEKKPSLAIREKFYNQMVENAKALSEKGVFVSAETMLNSRTLPHLEAIHDKVVEMGCRRHEIHPMYPSDFASKLNVATLDEIREGIHRLLDHRDENVWMLFGTLPFYPCSPKEEDLQLLSRLYKEKNVSVRNDPDGRSRLNVNIFNGEITVTDFGDIPSFGNVKDTGLTDAYAKWRETEIAKAIHCH